MLVDDLLHQRSNIDKDADVKVIVQIVWRPHLYSFYKLKQKSKMSIDIEIGDDDMNSAARFFNNEPKTAACLG